MSDDPAARAERWRRQMDTPYADLPEAEKESDRKEADRVLAVLGQAPAREGERKADAGLVEAAEHLSAASLATKGPLPDDLQAALEQFHAAMASFRVRSAAREGEPQT
jgi:hypothetical protein